MREEPYHHSVIHYFGPDGRRASKSTPGAVRRATETATYYGDLAPLPPRKEAERISLGTADYRTACEVLSIRRKERAREIEGLTDPTLAAARRPLTDHLEEWHRGLTAAGQTGKNARQLLARVAHLAELAGWSRVSDISLSSADAALVCLARERTRNMPADYEGRGPQTLNHYRSHLRQFCRWLVADGRLARDPLMKLARQEVAPDLRHARRCPTDAEMETLFAYLASPRCRVRLRMNGPCRALCYQTAMATGFRGNEMRSLTRESFDLVGKTVTVQAGYSKRRRLDVQPLPDWLVIALADHLAHPDARLWGTIQPAYPGRILRSDLEACGVPYSIKSKAGPLYFDFHALRHWYCTQIGRQPGISMKTLMVLCRHSTPSLSLKIYAHGRDADERAAASAVRKPGGSSS